MRSHVLSPRGRVGGADAGPVVGDVTGDSRRPWECSRASSGAVARAWRGRRVAGRWPAAWRGQSVTKELGAGHAGGTGWTRAGAVQLDEEEFLGTVGGDIAGWGRPCASVPRPSAVRPGQPSLEPAERTVRRRVAGRLGQLCEAICGRPGLTWLGTLPGRRRDCPWEPSPVHCSQVAFVFPLEAVLLADLCPTLAVGFRRLKGAPPGVTEPRNSRRPGGGCIRGGSREGSHGAGRVVGQERPGVPARARQVAGVTAQDDDADAAAAAQGGLAGRCPPCPPQGEFGWGRRTPSSPPGLGCLGAPC